MTAFRVMFKTELKLSLRNLDVPIFGIIFPLLVALILVAVGGTDEIAMAKVFAATITISIAANGLMGLPLTLSNYRSDKVLKQWRVTPISSFMVLFVQFMVKFFLCLVSAGLIFLLLLCFKFHFIGHAGFFLVSYFLVIFAVFGIGMIIASVSPNTNTTNLLCSIVYFPMLFLSGATIPLDILPKSIANLLQLLPMAQGIRLLESAAIGQTAPSLFLAVGSLLLIGGVSVLISIKMFKWE